MASSDLRSLIGKMYEVDHLTLLHTKLYELYVSWFLRKTLVFSPLYGYGSYDPWGVASLDTRVLITMIYVGDN